MDLLAAARGKPAARKRLERLVLALTLILAFPAGAGAQAVLPRAVRLHLVSWHDSGDFNNANPGAALRWNGGLAAGGFNNSYGRASWYAGLVVPLVERRFQVELMTGAITGYSESTPIDLVIVPSLGWRMSPRTSLQVVLMPRVVIPANAVHVMLERRLGRE